MVEKWLKNYLLGSASQVSIMKHFTVLENISLLVKNGVLLIDDYGHWAECKKAIDEYIEENNICVLLNRIDYTGCTSIKS